MFWFPLDLIATLNRSPRVRQAERRRILETLKGLRDAMTEEEGERPGAAIDTAQFGNFASELFCHAQVLDGSPVARGVGLGELALEVERALASSKREALCAEDAHRLRKRLDAAVSRLERAGLRDSD